jgi:hypothetical protein
MFRSHVGARVPEWEVHVKSRFQNGTRGDAKGRSTLSTCEITSLASYHFPLYFQYFTYPAGYGSQARSQCLSRNGLGRAFSEASEE